MIKQTARYSGLSTTCLRLLIFGGVLHSAWNAEAQTQADALGYFDAALGLWEDSASFRGEFKVKQFSAESIEKAEKFEFVAGVDIFRGFIAKSGSDVRLSVESVLGAQLQMNAESGRESWAGIPRDSLMARDLEALFFPLAAAEDAEGIRHRAGQQLIVQPRELNSRGVLGPPHNIRDVITPVSLMGKPIRSLFSSNAPFAGSVGTKSEFKASNVKLDSLRRALRLEWSTAETYVQIWCEFSFAETIPVIHQLDYRFGGKSEQDPESSLIRVVCGDFRDCDGTQVPASVLQIFKNSGTDKVVGRQFYSPDLGAESPRFEDFQILVSEAARIHGLKKWPEAIDGQRLIDLRELSKSEVLAQGEVQSYIGLNTPQVSPQLDDLQGQKSRVNWILILNVVGVIVAVCLAYSFGRRQRT